MVGRYLRPDVPVRFSLVFSCVMYMHTGIRNNPVELFFSAAGCVQLVPSFNFYGFIKYQEVVTVSYVNLNFFY